MAKKLLGKSVLFLLVLSLLGVANAAMAQDEPRVLLFSTGPAVTKDFAIGRGMATFWSLYLAQEHGLQCKAITSQGSEDNISRLKLHRADLAIVEQLVTTTALNGQGLYRGEPFGQLRVICRLWPNIENFVSTKAKAKSGNVTDVKGMVLSAGSADSGQYSTLVILQALGIGRDDLELRDLGPFESYKALESGQLDAVSLADGPISFPIGQLMQCGQIGPVYLQFTAAQVETINAKSLYKGWLMKIDPNTYANQAAPLFTMAQDNYLVCRAELPAQTVYLLIKTLFEKFTQWGGDLGFPREMLTDPKRTLSGMALPLHEGAYRYFTELGLSVPSQIRPPELTPASSAAPARAPAPPQS